MIATPRQVGKYEVLRYEGNADFISMLDSIPMGELPIEEQRYAKYVLITNMIVDEDDDKLSAILIGNMLIHGGDMLTNGTKIECITLCQAVQALKIEDNLQITADYTANQIETLNNIKEFIREASKVKKLTMPA